MPEFKLSRTVQCYEHCKIEAKDFDDALEQWNTTPEAFDGQWEDSNLGQDEILTAVASLNEKGEVVEDRDVDEKGRFESWEIINPKGE